MMELLLKTQEGKYIYSNSEMDCAPKHIDVIAIPVGAISLTIDESKCLTFWKNNFESMNVNGTHADSHWVSPLTNSSILTFDQYCGHPYDYLWQRNEQPSVEIGDINIAETLNARESTYGSFSNVAEMTQGLLFVMDQYGYKEMPDTHKEALHMICSKMARIVNGDHNHKDSWHDIGGYSALVERMCT